MKNNIKLGIVLSVLGILAGFLTLFLMAGQYNLVITRKLVDDFRMTMGIPASCKIQCLAENL